MLVVELVASGVPSRAYFPLRSNAKSLVVGQSLNSVRRRIKLSALLHDEVWIEDGVFIQWAGPTGGFSSWLPSDRQETVRWQTPRERGSSQGQEHSLSMAPEEVAGVPGTNFRTVLRSTATISWRATFEPLKTELPKAYDWIAFGHVNDSELGRLKSVADHWIRADLRDDCLRTMLPEQFVRSAVIKNANLDLAHGSRFAAAVNMEQLHANVARARLERGDARRVLGGVALSIILPSVGNLPWEDVDRVRRHRDIRYLREILRDVEAAALQDASSEPDFERRIYQAFQAKLAHATGRISGSFRQRLLVGAGGMVIGELVGQIAAGVPVVGGIAGVILSEGVGLSLDQVLGEYRRPKWLAAYEDIRRRS